MTHPSSYSVPMTTRGADGVKIDHMCQGVNCGSGVQGHMMAVPFQRPTIERWVKAIAAVNKTRSVRSSSSSLGNSSAQDQSGWIPQPSPGLGLGTSATTGWRDLQDLGPNTVFFPAW